MNDTAALALIISQMANAIEDHVFYLDVLQNSSDVDFEEMHNILYTDYNIKSAKILDNVFLYYLGTLSEEAEKALIIRVKFQYYINNCQ